MEKPAHIRSLTSLRGIAAVAIVILHYSYYTLPPTGKILSAYSYIFKNGYLWVDFFFILSGFIMTHLYLRQFESGVGWIKYRSYLWSRFARIYPLQLFTLLLLVALELTKFYWLNLPAFTGKFNLTALFANLVLLQAFDLNCPPLFWCDTYWNEPAWSVSVEFVIYLIFPLMLRFVTKISRNREAIIYIFTLALIFGLIRFTRGNLDAIIGIPAIFRCGLECILGIITYLIYQKINYDQTRNINVLATVSIMWIGLILHNWSDFDRTLHDWLILPGFSMLILAVSGKSRHSINRLLHAPLLFYLGTISYSIYLVHWVIGEVWKTSWNYHFDTVFGRGWNEGEMILSLVVFIFSTLAAASLSYRYIELPMRHWLKSIT